MSITANAARVDVTVMRNTAGEGRTFVTIVFDGQEPESFGYDRADDLINALVTGVEAENGVTD